MTRSCRPLPSSLSPLHPAPQAHVTTSPPPDWLLRIPSGRTGPPSQLPDSKMAAAHCAHPNGWTSLTPGPPFSRSSPPSFGLHLYASGLVTGNPAPPEPRLLLVTVRCPSERRAPTAPRPGRYFPFRWGLGGGGRGKGCRGEVAGEGGGGLAGASGGAGVSALRPGGGRLHSLGQSEGTAPVGGQTRPLGDCTVRAHPAWPQVPLDEAAQSAPTGECPRGPCLAQPAPATRPLCRP